MSSSPRHKAPCEACRLKDKTIKGLHDKLELVQKNFRGVVAAMKKSQADEKDRLREKDSLIAEMMSRATGSAQQDSLTLAQQERIAELEANISELSTICGEYKNLRSRDRLMIDQLTAQVSCGMRDADRDQNPALNHTVIKLFRNRSAQTDDEEVALIQLQETATQTDEAEPFIPVISSSSAMEKILRKPELAVIIPTSHHNLSDDSKSIESQDADCNIREMTSALTSMAPLTPADGLDVLKLPARPPSSPSRKLRRSSTSSSGTDILTGVCK